MSETSDWKVEYYDGAVRVSHKGDPAGHIDGNGDAFEGVEPWPDEIRSKATFLAINLPHELREDQHILRNGKLVRFFMRHDGEAEVEVEDGLILVTTQGSDGTDFAEPSPRLHAWRDKQLSKWTFEWEEDEKRVKCNGSVAEGDLEAYYGEKQWAPLALTLMPYWARRIAEGMRAERTGEYWPPISEGKRKITFRMRDDGEAEIIEPDGETVVAHHTGIPWSSNSPPGFGDELWAAKKFRDFQKGQQS